MSVICLGEKLNSYKASLHSVVCQIDAEGLAYHPEEWSEGVGKLSHP